LRRREFRLDFVGTGAARSGTSWIARCLRERPRIFLPPKKESHYFNLGRTEELLRMDLSRWKHPRPRRA
jgi:hypothetical protein